MLLRQMKYFLAAVYCKSFNEAAKQCFISQPSFSLQIKQLEKELGVKLINRNNCSFSLTPEGEQFYEPCKRIVGDVQNLLQNMQHLSEKSKMPRYVIGCKIGYNVSRLLNIINTLNNNTDLYHLEITYGDHEQLMSMLRNKEIDMAISEERKADSESFAEEVLEITGLYVCVGKQSVAEDKEYLTLADLRKHLCVIVANREYAEQEQEYYTQLLGYQGDFFVVRDMTAALTKVSDSQSQAFMLLNNSSDMPSYFQDFTRLLPLVNEKQQMEIAYKMYWSKGKNKRLTSIVQHIVSLLLDH